jgi:hypothetical protein
LTVASFGGSRRDKLVAHLGLAVIGSIALIIGTAVSGIEWLAVLVPIPVALTQAVDWALGTRRDPPDTAAAAVTAGIRLDEALRGFLAEQGAKRLSKEDLWMLVVATMQLRLTATSLASLQALLLIFRTCSGWESA